MVSTSKVTPVAQKCQVGGLYCDEIKKGVEVVSSEMFIPIGLPLRPTYLADCYPVTSPCLLYCVSMSI